MKNIIGKITSKENLPILLFFIIVLNYIPIIAVNIVSKSAVAGSAKSMAIIFAIECIILGLFFIKKIKFSRDSIINIAILGVTTTVLLLVQVFKLLNGTCEMFDFANIICIAINIIMLYIILFEINVSEKSVYYFFVGIISMGIVACVVNIFMYHNEIIKLLGINTESKFYSIKSFFAHRNQFATFLYFSLISSLFLFMRTEKKSLKALLVAIMLIFIANLVFTASRTGILATAIFSGLWFLLTDRLSVKSKIIIGVLGVIVLGLLLGLVYQFKPSIIETIEKNFIRKSSLKTFTGRSKVWEEGIKLLSENPVNIFVGIGRFYGEKLIDEKYNIEHFHNFYLESLITGGIMELAYFIFIYASVLRRVCKSNLEKKYIITYVCMYISYAIYVLCEVLGRFSMGYIDTMCFIIMISIPLLHANSVKNLEDKK